MEPAPRTLKINYTIVTTVKRVEARGQEPDIGWWIQFDGSWESLYFGQDRPRFEEGDQIKITFERIDA